MSNFEGKKEKENIQTIKTRFTAKRGFSGFKNENNQEKGGGFLTLEEGRVEMKEGEYGPSSSLVSRKYTFVEVSSSKNIVLQKGIRLKSFAASAKAWKSPPPPAGSEEHNTAGRRRRSWVSVGGGRGWWEWGVGE